MATEDFGPEPGDHGFVINGGLDPTLAGPALRSETGDGEVNEDGLTEAETIEMAEAEIKMAQYRAVHNRLEDFVVYLEAMGYIAPQALVGTDGLDLTNADHHGQLFELVETYLDGVGDAEYEGAVLDKILKPDLDD